MADKKKKKLNVGLLWRITRLALPYRTLFVWAVILTIVQSLLSATQPYFFQYVIDNFIVRIDLDGLKRWSLIILGLLILQSILGFITSYMTEIIGQNVIYEMRKYVYRHLVSLRLSFYDKTPVGTAVTRTVSDIETIAELFASGLITIAGDLFQIVVILGLMFWMNWKLALISLLVLPLLLYAANIFRKAVRDSFQEVRTEVTRLNAFLQEHITGMQIVQIFNREKAEMQKFKNINAKHRDANIKGVFYYAVFFPVVDVIVAITLALIVWYGTFGLLKGVAGIGELTAFIMFINLFFRPIRMVADRFNNIQMGMVAAERIFHLIDDENNLEKGGKIVAENLRGEIEFQHVEFGYLSEQPVIKDLSFKIDAGKTLAIVGHTGSGKTTLVNLVSRFYTHEKGTILIDGIPVENYELASLRKKIAVVLQDVFLFSGSITDNIRLKDENIGAAEIEAAAKTIGAYDFIQSLPGNFDFNVMERGMSLSLGQRQLVSFIRALALNPSVIVLDEATSSVDSETEALIQHAIQTLLKGRTAMVIAHRLSTIQHADKIIVLEKGVLVEEGTHAQLLAKNGKYAELYHTQLIAAEEV
ncbi:MAG: ABC transporter ATP-binding protein [Bacteroidetes bacterium]|nr:ABC transporter ATP-binding protein [Bacteroidota bacterium]